jgi:hypothetical protein
LLPDGRVWTASSTPTKTGWEPRIEIFSPGYYFETRPAISGEPIVAGDGSTIVIPTLNAASITSVSLVRLGSQTHHYDANQRLVWLQIVTKTSNSVTVSAPINNRIAPPGYYMIHVLNSNNIPSVAKIIKISGRTAGETFYDVPYPGNSTIGLGSSTSVFRVGEQAYGSASQLIGKSLKEWTVYLKKTGSASGNVTAVVRRNSNDAIVATFNPIVNASTLPTSFAPRLFTLTSPYTIQYGDRIMIQYTGPGSVDISNWTTDKFDGGNTRRTRYLTSYSSSSGSDVVGKMSTG